MTIPRLFRTVATRTLCLSAFMWLSVSSVAGDEVLQEPAQLDKELVMIEGRTQVARQIYSGVMQGVRLLPPNVKRKFLEAHIKIVLVPSSAEDVKDGKSHFQPKRKRVVIPECADLKRLPINTLHELGHAYDFLGSYLSKSPQFLQAYYEDSSKASPAMRRFLEYFLQPGHRGPSECFASLFARKYYKGSDKRLIALQSTFPQSYKFVCDLRD